MTLNLDDGTTWTVNNAEGEAAGRSTSAGHVDSVNVVYAQLDLDAGPETWNGREARDHVAVRRLSRPRGSADFGSA